MRKNNWTNNNLLWSSGESQRMAEAMVRKPKATKKAIGKP